MTHRGPFQPIPFCDSVIYDSVKVKSTADKVISMSEYTVKH